jgi:hypothetical protein
MTNVEAMKLDVYRSCSWKEKRQVLETFWRSTGDPSPKIVEAAKQYGPPAVLCLIIMAIEMVIVTTVGLVRGYVWGWAALVVSVLVLLSLWWAIMRNWSLGDDLAANS